MNDSLMLLTDLYQLTMAYGYWKNKMTDKESVFHLFFRKQPFGGGFGLAAGLENVIDFLKNFHFSSNDLKYLHSLELFSSDFLNYLSSLKFTCDLDAVPEGTIVFPYEPLLRIQGPLIQCQLLESIFLNLINFPSLIATKAARICLAAQNDSVIEFGLRRAQGINGALAASRASFIGGCKSTSNVLAGKKYGIPVRGTHAHSWIMSFENEEKAFQAFVEVLPDQSIFLVDTYHTLNGVKNAIKVGKWLKQQGKEFLGIRLDSGDLAQLSIQCRLLLDQEGFKNTYILASNELDEFIIRDLKNQGAKIDVWGVGTRLVTGYDQPALDGVYKLSAIRDFLNPWEYKLKISEQIVKTTNPGILQIKRFTLNNQYVADGIYDIHKGISNSSCLIDPLDPTSKIKIEKNWLSEDLLIPIFRQGKCLYTPPKLQEIQKYAQSNLKNLPIGVKRLLNPQKYRVGLEKTLYLLKSELIAKQRNS